MIPSRHVIDTAVFELEVPDEGVTVADFVQTRLLPLAESIFEEFSQPGQVVRIEHLELDLGPCPRGDWRRELERRFGEELRAELRSRVEGAAVPAAAAELEVLAHLLGTGTLPWTGGAGDMSLDALAARALRQDPRGFAALLRGRGKGAVMLDRLVRQGSVATVAAALAALAGGTPGEWERLLLQEDGVEGGGAAPETRREAGRRALAREVLARSSGGGALPTPPGVEASGAPPSGLQARLASALRAGVPVPSQAARLVSSRALMELVETLDPPSARVVAAFLGSPAAAMEGVAGGVGVEGLPAGGLLEELAREEVLSHLVRGDRSLDRRSLAEGLRRRLVELGAASGAGERDPGAPPTASASAAGAPAGPEVAGGREGAVGDARSRGGPPGPSGTAEDPGVPAGVEGDARAPGDTPDTRHAAVAQGGSTGSTAAAGSVGGAGDPGDAGTAPARTALGVGHGPPGVEGATRPPGESPERSGDGDHGAEGIPVPYARLQALFLEDRAGSGEGALLEAVLAAHPDDRLRMLEVLRDGGAEVLERLADWPGERVRRLAEAVLSLISRRGPDGGRALREAVAAAGARVAEAKGFYLELIRAALDGELIDLEALERRHREPGSGAGPRGVEGEGERAASPAAAQELPAGRSEPVNPAPGGGAGAPGSPWPENPSGALAEIRALLGQGVEEPLGTPSAAPPRRKVIPGLRLAVERALAADPASLPTLLERTLREAAAVDRLVDALPSPTLARLLLLLRPEAGETLRALDLLAGASVARRGSVAGVEGRKWRFLFRHGTGAGGMPPLEETVRDFFLLLVGPSGADSPEADLRPPEARDLLEEVVARVSAGTLSSPETGRRILEALSAPSSPAPGGTAGDSAGTAGTSAGVPPRPGAAPSGAGATPPSAGSPGAGSGGATPAAPLSAPPSVSEPGAGSGASSPAAHPALPGADAAARPGESAPSSRPSTPPVRQDAMPRRPPTGPPWSTTETLFITNAGIVLAAPWLPRLFSMLELTGEGGFHTPDEAARAAHLIQYLVEGRTDRPEMLLPLNRILCGLGEDHPLPASIRPTPREEEVMGGLLSALLQHWGALGNTTVAGLQESFFQREGALQGREDGWRLQVEPRAFDMLIDRIPWSFNIIRFPWMDRALFVEWRG